jgi:hypothetical protein
MATTHIAFDTRSGRIISAHHGAEDLKMATQIVHQQATLHPQAKIEKDYIEVIAVPADSMHPGKQYKIDPRSKSLIPISAGESGVSFGFGASARFGSKSPKSS